MVSVTVLYQGIGPRWIWVRGRKGCKLYSVDLSGFAVSVIGAPHGNFPLAGLVLLQRTEAKLIKIGILLKSIPQLQSEESKNIL